MRNFSGLKQHNWRNFLADTVGGRVSDSEFDGLLQKASYDTSTQGIVNDVFGAVLFAQYNSENQWYQGLPIVDKSTQGFSLGDTVPAKAYRAAHSPVNLQTHSEGGAVPSGQTMSVEEFSVEVKRSDTVIEVSDLQQIESMIEDAVGFDELWELQEEQLDLAIDRDAIAAPALEADSAYSATDEITPLDRAISSQDEEANADDVNDTAYTDGALDYGTVDRSADSWADSYVDHNGVSGNRQLTRDLMDDFLANLGDNGDADPYEEGVIFTGRDTAKILSDLMADSGRGTHIEFDGGSSGTDNVNDAETMAGLAGTTRFRHYDEIPILPNQHAPADGVSRIYVLPMGTIRGEPRVCIEQYAEPYTERAGRGQSQGYLATGQYEEQGLMTLNHELKVNDFPSTGKLRDLSA